LQADIAADVDESTGQALDVEAAKAADEDSQLSYVAVDEVIDQATSRPWTSDDIPPLADWIAANERWMDLIVEASTRPRYYWPSATMLNGQHDSLVATPLGQVHVLREAALSLSARAMWHLGENRIDEAWQDLRAVHRLARSLTQGPTLIEHLVAIAISGIACDSTLALLDHNKLTAEQARRVQLDLAAVPSFAGLADSIDRWERFSALDTALFASADFGAVFAGAEIEGNRALVSLLDFVSVDWSFVLLQTNRWYDRLAAAARLPDRADRTSASAQISSDLQSFTAKATAPSSLLTSVVSRRQRSDLVAAILISVFLPAVDAASTAQDRANTKLALTRLGAALAVYRADNNACPEKLDDLVPRVLDKLPVDLYNAKPFIYRRDGMGYLLYSAGENGGDDGGSHEQWGVLEGNWINKSDEAQAETMQSRIPAGADDISIRLPRPSFSPPTSPPSNRDR
jgi:type II secretory pathway pseudopilin PulG